MEYSENELNAVELTQKMSELNQQKVQLETQIKMIEAQMHEISEKLCWASGACSGSGRVSA